MFYTIYRKGLWYELHNMGIDGKNLKFIRSIYSTVKSCVSHCNQCSEYSDVTVSLR